MGWRNALLNALKTPIEGSQFGEKIFWSIISSFLLFFFFFFLIHFLLLVDLGICREGYSRASKSHPSKPKKREHCTHLTSPKTLPSGPQSPAWFVGNNGGHMGGVLMGLPLAGLT